MQKGLIETGKFGLQGIVRHTTTAKTNGAKIMRCYVIAHAEIASRQWLMCQGSGWGSMGLSQFEYWILMVFVVVQ